MVRNKKPKDTIQTNPILPENRRKRSQNKHSEKRQSRGSGKALDESLLAKKRNEQDRTSDEQIIQEEIEYNIGEITLEEIRKILKQFEKESGPRRNTQLFKAMERMGIDRKLINMVKQLYKNPKFKVEMEGHTS